MRALLNSILSEFTNSFINSYSKFDSLIVSTCSPSLHGAFYSSLSSNNAEGVRAVLDQVSWTEETSTSIENLLNAKQSSICLDSKVIIILYHE